MTARERLAALEHFGIKLGLDHIGRILDAIGNPQDAWPAVHVAGTNGKGSVAAMVECAFRAAGHRTGRYTSPHLAHIEERVAIGGAPVAPADFDAALGTIFDAIDGLRRAGTMDALPTYFETTTAVAFELFRRAGVETGIVEVGLGGRYDATNVLRPMVTAVTTIALDHERHLGGTLGAIAAEKAGIAKPGVPMIVGRLPGEALAAVRIRCAEARAPVVLAHDDVACDTQMTEGRATLTIRTPVRTYSPVTLALAGRHQADNAIVAVRILEAAGMRLGGDAIAAGLRDATWPARLEWVPAGSGSLLLDAAHNPAGASALATYLADAGVVPVPIVMAVMRDKDVDGMLRALLPAASLLVATEVHSPRGLPADELADRARRCAGARPPVVVVRDPGAAVALALDEAPRAVAAGSIFLVGPLRTRFAR